MSSLRGKGRDPLVNEGEKQTIYEDYNLQNATNNDKAANKDDNKSNNEDSYKDNKADDENKDNAEVGD
eukprot:14930167-Ditylum_brightwellii.AAC.1